MSKPCIRCNDVWDLSHFKKSRWSGNLGNVCKRCQNSDAKRRREENPEKYKENRKRRLSKPENLESDKLSKLKYSRSEAGRRKKKQWIEDNKEYYLALSRMYCVNRRARKLQARPSWANDEEILKIYDRCRRISLWLDVPHHVDHAVPLKSDIVCGLHCEANLEIIPAKENQLKGNRWWKDMP